MGVDDKSEWAEVVGIRESSQKENYVEGKRRFVN